MAQSKSKSMKQLSEDKVEYMKHLSEDKVKYLKELSQSKLEYEKVRGELRVANLTAKNSEPRLRLMEKTIEHQRQELLQMKMTAASRLGSSDMIPHILRLNLLIWSRCAEL